MAKKRTCVFNEDLRNEYTFLSPTYCNSRVLCRTCGTCFSLAHGGRSDISQHIRSQKHKNAEKARSVSASVSSFFLQNSDADKVAAAEALFAYHTIRHGQTFRSNDCTSQLIKKLFQPKYCSARTKCEVIICNVLAPLSLEELTASLNSCSYVTLSVDASNRKEQKMFPVLVRYFDPRSGVQTKVLEFSSLSSETSNLQTSYLNTVIEKYSLQTKVVGLCADNTNTNFGGAKRLGQNNVWRKLQKALGRNVIGIGCGAHIVHNCLQSGVDCLPFDVESFAVKVYKYFHIYTVRVEELKEFCAFAGIEYAKLLEHGSTRFLSLGPALERILKIFEGLRSYFLSQEKCPAVLKAHFEHPCTELWLLFAKIQTNMFQKTVALLEKTDISATEAALHIATLRDVLVARKQELFVTTDVKRHLQELVEAGSIKENDFMKVVCDFYGTCIEYLDKWQDNYGATANLKWVLLRKMPEWQEIQSSLEELLSFLELTTKEDFEEALFYQWTIVKKSIEKKLEDWNSSGITVSERWVEVFKEMKTENVCCAEISRVVELALCFPGTTAPVERVFSIMNSMWTSEKSRLLVSTLRAMLLVRLNFPYKCADFYNRVLQDKVLLRKLQSSAKYAHTNEGPEAGPSK